MPEATQRDVRDGVEGTIKWWARKTQVRQAIRLKGAVRIVVLTQSDNLVGSRKLRDCLGPCCPITAWTAYLKRKRGNSARETIFNDPVVVTIQDQEVRKSTKLKRIAKSWYRSRFGTTWCSCQQPRATGDC